MYRLAAVHEAAGVFGLVEAIKVDGFLIDFKFIRKENQLYMLYMLNMFKMLNMFYMLDMLDVLNMLVGAIEVDRILIGFKSLKKKT